MAGPRNSSTGPMTLATVAGSVRSASRSRRWRTCSQADMLAGRETHRSTGTRAGEVGFRHQYGEGRRLLPQTGPFAVVVRLQRLPAGWWVLGVNGPSIQITSPTRLQQISSPLTIRGTAEVYEGTLYFKVTQDRPGRDLLLGQGLVDGRASTQPGDLGTLRFRQPASTGPGWVTFSDASADGSNAIIQARWHRWRAAVHRASIAQTLGTPPAPHHRGAGRLQWTHPGSLTPQPVRCPPRACWPRGI
jgi:hypothetical protein